MDARAVFVRAYDDALWRMKARVNSFLTTRVTAQRRLALDHDALAKQTIHPTSRPVFTCNGLRYQDGTPGLSLVLSGYATLNALGDSVPIARQGTLDKASERRMRFLVDSMHAAGIAINYVELVNVPVPVFDRAIRVNPRTEARGLGSYILWLTFGAAIESDSGQTVFMKEVHFDLARLMLVWPGVQPLSLIERDHASELGSPTGRWRGSAELLAASYPARIGNEPRASNERFHHLVYFTPKARGEAFLGMVVDALMVSARKLPGIGRIGLVFFARLAEALLHVTREQLVPFICDMQTLGKWHAMTAWVEAATNDPIIFPTPNTTDETEEDKITAAYHEEQHLERSVPVFNVVAQCAWFMANVPATERSEAHARSITYMHAKHGGSVGLSPPALAFDRLAATTPEEAQHMVGAQRSAYAAQGVSGLQQTALCVHGIRVLVNRDAKINALLTSEMEVLFRQLACEYFMRLAVMFSEHYGFTVICSPSTAKTNDFRSYMLPPLLSADYARQFFEPSGKALADRFHTLEYWGHTTGIAMPLGITRWTPPDTKAVLNGVKPRDMIFDDVEPLQEQLHRHETIPPAAKRPRYV